VSRWQAVVFDLDDTIYPEQAFVSSGFRSVASWLASRYGIPEGITFSELHGLFRSGVRGNTFDLWAVQHNLQDEGIVAQLVAVYREHTPLIEPFPEAVMLLQELHNQVKTALVTDGPLAVQQRKLQSLGIGHFFDAVVFSDAWGREAWKPSTIPYLHALATLKVDPQNAVYIGDNSKKDFLGARRAGMHSIKLCYAQGEYAGCEPATPDHAPDFSVPDFGALRHLLMIHS
jgi:putative hydrolase of the HAD superfamily